MRHLMMLALTLAGCTINGKTYGFGNKPVTPQYGPAPTDRAEAGPGKAPVDSQQHDDLGPDNEPEPAKGTGELAQLVVKPEPGIATAKAQPPPWCATATKVPGTWSPGGVRRTLEAVSSEGTGHLLKGAALLCQWPKDPAVAHATGAVLQMWMNTTGLSQVQATESLTARLATDRFAADQSKLCAALQVNGTEQEQHYADARQKLFGCTGDPLWVAATGFAATHDDLAAYFDASVGEIDPIVRAAHLLSRTAHVRSGKHGDKALLSYITDQVDFASMTPASLDKALDAAPYKGNSYARALALESRSVLASEMADIKAAVDAKAKDPAWRELLVNAPQRGIAEWNKLGAQYKDALARSAAFAQKLASGSRSAAAGCWPTFRKDFLDVLKSLPHATEDEIKRATAHPIASILFSRLADCAAVDQDPAYASKLLELAAGVRVTRGPRMAAFYAATAAYAKIRDDKPSFPVEISDLRILRDMRSGSVTQFIDMAKSKYDRMGWVGGDGEGVVQTAQRNGDHVLVVFRPDRVSYAERACKKTNRIERINSSGVFEYEYDCWLTGGTVVVDRRPEAVKIPAEWADNIRPGTLLKFEAARGKTDRWALPVTTFADATRKKLVNVYGFGL